jgi:hypothetical protein
MSFARILYFDKFGIPDTSSLQKGAEAWLCATAALFGNEAIVLCLNDREIPVMTEQTTLLTLRKLLMFKREFRSHRQFVKDTITVTCQIEGISYGVFFDYLHSTDPDIERLALEWKWIVQSK